MLSESVPTVGGVWDVPHDMAAVPQHVASCVARLSVCVEWALVLHTHSDTANRLHYLVNRARCVDEEFGNTHVGGLAFR